MAKLSQPYTKERLQKVLEGTRLGMWDWNPQTNEVVFDHNWAEMLGVTLDDLTMTLDDWSSRVHPDDIDSCFADIQAHMEGKTDYYENLHRMKHADGHWRYILDRGAVVERDADGNVTRFTGTHTDITPLKKAEFQATQALQQRERFFSSMSHELRAPVHAMMGIVEMVSKKLTDPELTAQLDIVRNSGQHLLMVIKDILDAAKLQEANLSLSPSVFNVADLMNYVVQLYMINAAQKDLMLFTSVSEAMSTEVVEMDRSRLAQILINLVSNSIKYTEHGEVELSLTEEEGQLAITVRDTGVGIADVNRIFEPYEQEMSAREDDVNSTGLGLHICQVISAMLGIELTVISSLGKGSEFRLTLPASCRRTPDDVVELNEQDAVVDISQWPPLTLLIVDDTAINISVAVTMLSETPCRILVAKNGLKALEILKKTDVDVVFTDLHMPEMGGLGLTAAIRGDSSIKPPKIIGQSADAQQEMQNKCLAAGMDGYLAKPFSQQDLFRVIQRIAVDA